ACWATIPGPASSARGSMSPHTLRCRIKAVSCMVPLAHDFERMLAPALLPGAWPGRRRGGGRCARVRDGYRAENKGSWASAGRAFTAQRLQVLVAQPADERPAGEPAAVRLGRRVDDAHQQGAGQPAPLAEQLDHQDAPGPDARGAVQADPGRRDVVDPRLGG